jgi:thiamine biosynthesis lipoprotein
MDTVVTIEVSTTQPEEHVRSAMQRALHWFDLVERTCSRFDPHSELRELTEHVGEPRTASTVLFEAVSFALALADLTHGVFDPTIGHVLENRGFNRHYLTGAATPSGLPSDVRSSFRDIRLNARRRTITLLKPLVLDLGAVAKGLAIDLAARELGAFGSFCVEAGGDLFAKGVNGHRQPWRVGVQDPRERSAVAYTLELANQAVCTSGDYERRTPDVDGIQHHLVDPRTGQSARELASVTVVAPTALAADGLATAAFILGPRRGLRLLEGQGVGGVLISAHGQIQTTRGFGRSLDG